jgi:hypothetical protein
MITRKAISQVVEAVIEGGAKQAIKYFGPRLVLKATFVGKRKNESKMHRSILLTYGSPNSRERQFIKDCKTAGEPFPVRRIQLKFAKQK